MTPVKKKIRRGEGIEKDWDRGATLERAVRAGLFYDMTFEEEPESKETEFQRCKGKNSPGRERKAAKIPKWKCAQCV